MLQGLMGLMRHDTIYEDQDVKEVIRKHPGDLYNRQDIFQWGSTGSDHEAIDITLRAVYRTEVR